MLLFLLSRVDWETCRTTDLKFAYVCNVVQLRTSTDFIAKSPNSAGPAKPIPTPLKYEFRSNRCWNSCSMRSQSLIILNKGASYASCYSLYICTRAFGPRYGGKLPLTIEI